MKKYRKYIYTIQHDGNDWVSTTSEFEGLSGCSSTPRESLRQLSIAIAAERKTVKQDYK